MDVLSTRAKTTAARLRLLQGRFADDTDTTRQEELAEVVKQALSTIDPGDRSSFLRHLADSFPTWHTDATPVEPVPGVTEGPPSAAQLVTEIVALPADVQQQVLQGLEQHGLAAPPAATAAPTPDAAAQDLMREMGLAELDPERVFVLFQRLAQFIKSFERVTWSTWRLIAPRSSIKRTAASADMISAFVSGQGDTTLEDVDSNLELLRKLAAALVASISQIGQRITQEYFARMSPKEIETLIGVEKGGLLTSREVRCWRKYEELAGTFDEMAFEQEVKSMIAAYVESLLKTSGQ